MSESLSFRRQSATAQRAVVPVVFTVSSVEGIMIGGARKHYKTARTHFNFSRTRGDLNLPI